MPRMTQSSNLPCTLPISQAQKPLREKERKTLAARYGAGFYFLFCSSSFVEGRFKKTTPFGSEPGWSCTNTRCRRAFVSFTEPSRSRFAGPLLPRQRMNSTEKGKKDLYVINSTCQRKASMKSIIDVDPLPLLVDQSHNGNHLVRFRSTGTLTVSRCENLLLLLQH